MGEGRTPRPRPARGSRLRACSAIFFSRTRSRTDALPDRAQAVNLSPPTGRSAGRPSPLFVLEARGGEALRKISDFAARAEEGFAVIFVAFRITKGEGL